MRAAGQHMPARSSPTAATGSVASHASTQRVRARCAPFPTRQSIRLRRLAIAPVAIGDPEGCAGTQGCGDPRSVPHRGFKKGNVAARRRQLSASRWSNRPGALETLSSVPATTRRTFGNRHESGGLIPNARSMLYTPSMGDPQHTSRGERERVAAFRGGSHARSAATGRTVRAEPHPVDQRGSNGRGLPRCGSLFSYLGCATHPCGCV
jgi:hypothetical protein